MDEQIERTIRRTTKTRTETRLGVSHAEDTHGRWKWLSRIIEMVGDVLPLRFHRTVEKETTEDITEVVRRREDLETAVREESQSVLEEQARQDEQRKLSAGHDPSKPLPASPSEQLEARASLERLIEEARKAGYDIRLEDPRGNDEPGQQSSTD